MPLLDIDQVAGSLMSFTILALLLVDLSFLSALRSRVVSRYKTIRLLDGFVKTAGIRPPPALPLSA
jgi:hypothetical protein